MNKPPFSLRKALARLGNIYVAIVAWAIVLNFGFASLLAYATRPGVDAAPPVVWPILSGIARDPSRLTLLVFAHPRCPCTEATLRELSEMMALVGDRVSASVVFLEPAGGDPAGTKQSRNWRQAATIPGVKILGDVDGIEARNFGAKTSGRTVLFDPAGRLLFQGGITAARGEGGPNAGRDAIVAFAENASPQITRTPAYGCPLSALERSAK